MYFRKDNHDIFYRTWVPGGSSKAVVVIVHGYGEHSGRYNPAASALAGAGYRVYAYDHPGHGGSRGKKGLVEGLEKLADVLGDFTAFAAEEEPGYKVFVLGHSMGGVVSALYASRLPGDGPVSGLITTGAAVEVKPSMGKGLQKTLRAVSRIAPGLPTIKLSRAKLSKDIEVVDSYDRDPLNYSGRVKLKTGVELSRAFRLITENAGNITIPLLVLHGGEDTLSLPGGSSLIHDSASSGDKKIRIFPGLKHEILNEPEKNMVFEEIINWLDSRV